MKIFTLILILFSKIYNINSHTWVDELSCSCPETIGYSRGYISRECLPDSFDEYNTYQIDCRKDEALICSPHQSKNFNYPEQPKLKCSPGSTVTLTYNPNGHISKDPCIEGDPRECRGNLSPMTYIYIMSNKDIYPEELKTRGDVDNNYGLADYTPEYDANLKNVVAKFSFDANGTCQEDGEPCKISFQLPMDLKNHTDYQFIFYHSFDRDPFSTTSETYTSCMTIHSHFHPECMNKPGPHCP